MSNDIFEKLKEPFDPKDLEFRVGRTTQDKSKGLVFTYVTSRAIMDRLDEAVGPTEWYNDVKVHEQGIVATLTIRVGGEWVMRQDGAQYTNIESFKGGISDALKRVAVLFGIGRYLYTLPQSWVELDNGRLSGSAIKKLRKEMEHFSGSYIRVKNTPTMTPKQKHYSGEEGMPLDDIGLVDPSDLPPVPQEPKVISFGDDEVKKKVMKNVMNVTPKVNYEKPKVVHGVRPVTEDLLADAGLKATEVSLNDTVYGLLSEAQKTKFVAFLVKLIVQKDSSFDLLSFASNYPVESGYKKKFTDDLEDYAVECGANWKKKTK